MLKPCQHFMRSIFVHSTLVRSTIGAVMPMVVSFTAITTAASLYTFKIVQNAQAQAAYVAKKNHIESFKLRLMQHLEGEECKDAFVNWQDSRFTCDNKAGSNCDNDNDFVYKYIENSESTAELHLSANNKYKYGDLVGGGLKLIYVGIRHWDCVNQQPDPNTYPELIALCDPEYTSGDNEYYKWGLVEFALQDVNSELALPSQYVPVLWVYKGTGELKQCFAGSRVLSCRQMGGCGYIDDKKGFSCDIRSVIESEQGGCSFGGYYSMFSNKEDEIVGDCQAKNPLTCGCTCPSDGYTPTQVLGLRSDNQGKRRVALYACVRCINKCGELVRVNSCMLNSPEEQKRARDDLQQQLNKVCTNAQCMNINTPVQCTAANGTWNKDATPSCSNCQLGNVHPRCSRDQNNSTNNRDQQDSCERQFYEQKCTECCNNHGSGGGYGNCSQYCNYDSENSWPDCN